MSPSFSLSCFARLPVFVAPFPAFSLGGAVRIVKVQVNSGVSRTIDHFWRKKGKRFLLAPIMYTMLLNFFLERRDEESKFYFSKEYFYYFYYSFSFIVKDLFNFTFTKFSFSIVDSRGYILFFFF